MPLFVAFVFQAFALDCADPVTPTELEGSMIAAEAAWRDLDDVGFRDRVNELAGILLPCVGQPVTSGQSARYHALMAMHLHAIGDGDGARAAITAVKVGAPDYAFDDTLLPPGHDLRVAFDAIVVEAEPRKVPEPRSGSLAFDGAPSRFRPVAHPSIVQVLDESGQAETTLYLGARERLPPYAAIPRKRNLLLACAGGGAVLAGTSYAMAWDRHSHLYELAADTATAPAALESARSTTNVFTAASGALLGVGIGCGVGAGLIGER